MAQGLPLPGLEKDLNLAKSWNWVGESIQKKGLGTPPGNECKYRVSIKYESPNRYCIMLNRYYIIIAIRKIKTIKQMLHWSHSQFRQRLKYKAREYGSIVHEVGEHYSSKGCGQCGRIHWKLGASKVFKCPYCQFTTDRDFNGSRNIMLMNLENHLKVVNPRS